MEGVVGWFARRGDVPLTPPFRLREYAPLLDDPSDDHREFVNKDIRGVAFALEYCDSRGWASTRTVRCLAIDPLHPACISAFCNVRQEERAFRVDRIISIISLRTGRIVSSDEHMALLAPYLPGEPGPRLADLNTFQAATRDGIFALLTLAMPDGRLTDAARAVLLGYAESEAAASRCTMPPRRYIELWVDNLAPALDAIVEAVTNLLTDKDRFARLLPWLLKVVRSRDCSFDQEEAVRELIAEVRQHFRSKVIEWPGDLRATP
jgi:hypothetical protein